MTPLSQGSRPSAHNRSRDVPMKNAYSRAGVLQFQMYMPPHKCRISCGRTKYSGLIESCSPRDRVIKK
jgi:hypothetical protein